MVRLFRTFLFLPAVFLALVVLPSIAFSKGDWGTDLRSTLYQTVSPLPTATSPGTVPPPTATPTRQPYPTATPTRVYVAPTATPDSTDIMTPKINGVGLRWVIGDRLSSVIYAYTTQGWLYRSNNDGRTWRLVTTSPAVEDFIMSAADPDVLYSGAGIACDGLAHPTEPFYKSEDGGVNWGQVPGAENLRPLLAHQGDAASVFAAGCDAPYLSTDGGTTWSARPDSSPDALWSTYHVVDMTASTLLGDPQPETPNWEQLFAGGVAEDGSGVVAFSNDQGATWTRLTPNVFPASWGMNSVAADLFKAGLVAFAEPGSVWQSANFGVNWQVTNKGLETVADRGNFNGEFGLHDLLYHPDDHFFLATVRGLYRKDFAATTWEKVSDTPFDESVVYNLLYTETNLGTIWLNTEEGVFTYQVQ